MPIFFWVIIAIVIISSLVGALAKFLNNLNEMNVAKNRPPGGGGGAPVGAGGGGGGAVVRQSNTDMDRFLAEIDRLRRKNAEASPSPPNQAPVAPIVQPAKQPDRPRARVVAELADSVGRPDTGFAPALPTAPTATSGPKAGDLPVATVVAQPGGPAVPTTRVTRLMGRARPVAKTPFAKNLTTLLNSGQGLALAIVLQEILGPPACKKS